MQADAPDDAHAVAERPVGIRVRRQNAITLRRPTSAQW
jgi:hypothetical protein